MRGQTTLDFVIGIVIFLAVMFFVFGFVPGILEPFEIAGEDTPAHSDRIANSLAQEQLGNASSPYVLDRYCTVAFFEESEPPEECNYEGATLQERFNLPDYRAVNVTIEGNLSGGTTSSVLCWDDDPSDPGLAEGEDCTDNEFAIGDDMPDVGGSTITARRVVSLHGESVTLRVVVW